MDARSLLALMVWGMTACGPVDAARVTSPVVYGADDRREYFQSDPALRGLMERSMVAVMSKGRLARSGSSVRITGPSLAENVGLCPGEPFAEQPGAAFCSGVLVDWDLVLTAGHCAHVVPVDDLAVVFGYYYREPGALQVEASEVAAVVAQRESEPAARPHFDHAWLRLTRPVASPRAPVPIRSQLGPIARGAPLLFLGTSGGTPLKSDGGGVVADTGEPWRDGFLASTDTSAGASGGGAFDAELVLLGILEGGGDDYRQTDEGCKRVVRQDRDAEPKERFSRAARALEDLCARAPAASSLCRSDCGDPCLARPRPEGAGCAMARAGNDDRFGWILLALFAVGSIFRATARRFDAP